MSYSFNPLTGQFDYTADTSGFVLKAGDTMTGNLLMGTNKLQTAVIYPSADSTTAVQINKADGTTNVLNVDTTNTRLGIGTVAPASALHVKPTVDSTVAFGGGKALRIETQDGGRYSELFMVNSDDLYLFTSAGNIILKSFSGIVVNSSTAEGQGFAMYQIRGLNSSVFFDFYRGGAFYGTRFYNGDDIATASAKIFLFDDKDTVGRLTSSSGIQTFFAIEPTIYQSSTAGYTAHLINVTETTKGSGVKLIQDWQVGSVSKMSLNNVGDLTVVGKLGCNGATAQAAYASGGAVTTSAGAFGFSSDTERANLTTLVANIRTCLVNAGLMS